MADALRRNPFFSQTIVLGAMGGVRVEDAALATDAAADSGEAWESLAARTLRYRLCWGLYEQNLFARLHGLADLIRDRYDLEDSVRSLYSPGYRIGEFWPEHLYPGMVDPEAGDGSGVPSALPVLGASPELRAALARLWKDSHVAEVLESWTRFGSVMGDAIAKVVDDPWRKRVYLQAVHPANLSEYVADPAGNVRGYVIEKRLPDPEHDDPLFPAPLVTYREQCEREGEAVVFRTFREGELYDWRDYAPGEPRVGDTWVEEYGFVPMVIARHRNLGFKYGAGEFHFSLGKMVELDRLMSRICDQIGRIVRAPWYIGGEDVDVKDIKVAAPEGDGPGDDYLLLGGPGTPHSMVAAMNLEHALGIAQDLLEKLERDHPELVSEAVGANSSGEARRIAREKAEANVVRRRGGYDAAWARLQMMAVSIGGMGKYPGYERFDAKSFDAGLLEHSIGPRPVFALDMAARLDEEERRGKALKALTDAGLPLKLAMARVGFSAADVAAADREEKRAAREALARARSLRFGDGGGAGDGGDDPPPDAGGGDAAEGR